MFTKYALTFQLTLKKDGLPVSMVLKLLTRAGGLTGIQLTQDFNRVLQSKKPESQLTRSTSDDPSVRLKNNKYPESKSRIHD